MYSPAAIDGAAPSTVTRSRCPRALMRRTQKPLSALWKVTRSTRPANGSRSLDEPVMDSSWLLDTLLIWRQYEIQKRFDFEATCCRNFRTPATRRCEIF